MYSLFLFRDRIGTNYYNFFLANKKKITSKDKFYDEQTCENNSTNNNNR